MCKPFRHFLHQLLILFLYIGRSVDHDIAAEAKYPGVEHTARHDIHLGTEIFHVIAVGGDILSELVQDRIHDVVLADEIHRRKLRPIHPEAGLQVFVEIKVCREGKRIGLQDIRTPHDPVHTEGTDPLAVVEHADHVIEITVPDELMRAEDPRLTVVAQPGLLSDIILEIQEGNLLSGIDGFVDAVNDQVNTLVIVFDTVLRSNVPLQILSLVPASHL